MKLQKILDENQVGDAGSAGNSVVASHSGTTSGAVAKYSPTIDEEPIKRMKKKSFMKYATSEKECPGCSIIKKHGWDEVNGAPNKSKELICQMCGTIHKKGK
jgi:hypothetical protein